MECSAMTTRSALASPLPPSICRPCSRPASFPSPRHEIPAAAPPLLSIGKPRLPLLAAVMERPRRSAAAALCCSATNGAAEDTEPEVPIEKRFPPFPNVMDINQIREILPHRYPFLLVDRVIEHQPGVTAVGIKNVTVNDNFFNGHFPERPIMPGVLMVEALAQVGGIVMLQPEAGGSRQNFFFAGIDNVRFRKPVVPGDTLVMRMTLVKLQRRFGMAKMEGKAFVGDELVCEGEFLLVMDKSRE